MKPRDVLIVGRIVRHQRKAMRECGGGDQQIECTWSDATPLISERSSHVGRNSPYPSVDGDNWHSLDECFKPVIC